MAQACIYLDDTTMGFARKQAERERTSLSKYISELVQKDEKSKEWPQSFFATFGALSESDIEEPDELSWELDAPRQKMWE